MNPHAEQDLARKVVEALDHGARALDPRVTARLREARERALAGAGDGRRVPALAWALAGPGSAGGFRGTFLNARLWLAILAVAAGVVGVQQWQHQQSLVELEEIDTALLASDLPLDAFLDQGFQNWLKRREP